MSWHGLRKDRVVAAVLVALGVMAGGSGCMTSPDARYVYQDGEYGVVGIPRNSPYGRKDYNVQARELMTRHFPDGFEIVRAEEVVEGERTLDTATKKELATEPGFSAFNQMLKIGKFAHSSSLDEKDVTHITESRIIYRRKPLGEDASADGFARVANQAPGLYLDPNEVARKIDKEVMMVAKKVESDKDLHKDKPSEAKPDEKRSMLADSKSRDDGVQKASAATPTGP